MATLSSMGEPPPTNDAAQSNQPLSVTPTSHPTSMPASELPPPPATASSLPSLLPLSLAFSSSLYSAICRDASLSPTDSGLLSFRDLLFEQCSSHYLRLSQCQLGPHSATILSQCLLHSDELSDVHEVVVNGNSMRSYGLVQLLKPIARPASRLQVLEMRDNGIGNSGAKELAKVLVNNSTLRHLDLSSRARNPAKNNKIHGKAASQLAMSLSVNSSIQSLGMRKNPIGNDLFCVESYAMLIVRTLSLTHLNLQDCSLGPTGASILLRALTDNRTLLHVNLAANHIDHTVSESLVGCLQRNSTLVSLDLHDNPLGDVCMAGVVDALCRNMALIRLDVSKVGVTDASSTALCRLLDGQVSLTALYLSHNHLSSLGAQRLFDSLASNATLATLSLAHTHMHSQCYPGDAAAKGANAQARGQTPSDTEAAISTFRRSLQRCFARNNALESLDLRFCRLQDGDVCTLLSGVASAPASRLTSLKLSGNYLSSTVGSQLVSFLRVIPSLTALTLRSTQVSFHHASIIAQLCQQHRLTLEDTEPRRLRRLIARLQRDAIAYKQLLHRRTEEEAALTVIQQRVAVLEGTTRQYGDLHRDERSRLMSEMAAERLLCEQSRELFMQQQREMVAGEQLYIDRNNELQATLTREHSQRLVQEKQLVDMQKALEEIVKERPARVERMKAEVAEVRERGQRVHASVVAMRREWGRLQQATAAHQPVPHLLEYTKQLRKWYEWERRQREEKEKPPIEPSNHEAQQVPVVQESENEAT